MKFYKYFLNLVLICCVVLSISCNNSDKIKPNFKLIPYKSGDKWGYVDKAGKIMINPQFSLATVFVEDIALIRSSDDKFGYIGLDGRFIVNPQYIMATPFSEGLACVVLENGKPQFIDTKGNVKFTVDKGDYCGVFSDGLAIVKVGDKWGFIDKTGKIKINPQFDQVEPFSEGLAAVAKYFEEKDETLWGFVNENGELAINFQFKRNKNTYFKDGLACVHDGKLYGYIDKSGKYKINPQFDYASEFNEGLAIIQQGDMAGYIDKDGKIIINPQFKSAKSFSDGMAVVESSDNKLGYIDKQGKYIINPQFESASDFYDGIAFIQSGGKWGFIDKDGKYLINPQFDRISFDFNDYKYATVQSDYFDVSGVAEEFIKGTDLNNFRGLNAKSTLKELLQSYPDLMVNESSSSAITSSYIQLKEHISINSLEFNFSESLISGQKPVYRTVQKYDYWKGNYTAQEIDHYESVTNDNATIRTVTYSILLSGYKAKHKSNAIVEAINQSLQSKCSFKKENNSDNLINDEMSVSVSFRSNMNDDYIQYNVTFLKNKVSTPMNSEALPLMEGID